MQKPTEKLMQEIYSNVALNSSVVKDDDWIIWSRHWQVIPELVKKLAQMCAHKFVALQHPSYTCTSILHLPDVIHVIHVSGLRPFLLYFFAVLQTYSEALFQSPNPSGQYIIHIYMYRHVCVIAQATP